MYKTHICNVLNIHMFISMLLLSRFSRVRLCVTPETAAHQAPWSLGFSRQEHWSGLPFPSPMQESEEWKWSRSAVSNSLRPHGLQPTRLLCPWDFPGKSTGVGCHCLLQFISIYTHKYLCVCIIKTTKNKKHSSKVYEYHITDFKGLWQVFSNFFQQMMCYLPESKTKLLWAIATFC